MHLVYIDDSHDTKNYCFSALMLPAEKWYAHFAYLKQLRDALKASDGIHTTVELHATDFLGGRGEIAPAIISKARRAGLFNWYLDQLASMPDLSIIHACMADEYKAFEWMLNRIDRTMLARNDHAMLVSDQGKSYDTMLRRMRHINPIPSSVGAWPGGAPTQNIPIQRIIEDIVYRDSKHSMFIQAADFCAFALLRFIAPTSAATRFGFDQSLRRLAPAIFTGANRKCPFGLGIVGQ
jgi:hypothetical protein